MDDNDWSVGQPKIEDHPVLLSHREVILSDSLMVCNTPEGDRDIIKTETRYNNQLDISVCEGLKIDQNKLLSKSEDVAKKEAIPRRTRNLVELTEDRMLPALYLELVHTA